ncbi:hypothetical protein PR370_02675 [Mycobacterium marinum]|uniref:hypothetical protein n=1 Tax=Mycobacterium marinum TaxID=1781 RepID=UPI000B95FC5B|nr:hypothetical protein [Mycobacterium marinum]MDC8981701.1 hypothetical protein [Mycobacterium marinum]MDC8998722.1 hypothetical protein [Mycobacterium marinum]MDC9008952.1 hypothetical protein [Mycobacterium marinum]
MPITPDTPATTWRDRRRAGRHERVEQDNIPAAILLDYARMEIEGHLVDISCADMPTPAGVIWVGRWEMNLKREGWSRLLRWREIPRPGHVRRY